MACVHCSTLWIWSALAHTWCCSGVGSAVQGWAELFTGPQSLQWDLGKAPQAQCIPEHLPDSSEPYSAIWSKQTCLMTGRKFQLLLNQLGKASRDGVGYVRWKCPDKESMQWVYPVVPRVSGNSWHMARSNFWRLGNRNRTHLNVLNIANSFLLLKCAATRVPSFFYLILCFSACSHFIHWFVLY